MTEPGTQPTPGTIIDLNKLVQDPEFQNALSKALQPHTADAAEIHKLLNALLNVNIARRNSLYYVVTEEEVEVYAQFGFLGTICLAVFGGSTGFASGCVVAMLSSNISNESKTLLLGLAIGTGIAAVIFLILSVLLYWSQRRRKRAWKMPNGIS
jgi:hypothetical protein